LDRVVASALLAVLLATIAFGATRLGLGEVLGVGWGAVALSTFYAGRSISASLGGLLYTRSPRLTRVLPSAALLVIAASVYMQGVVRDPVILSLLTGVQGFAAGFVWPLVQTGVALHGGSTFILSLYFATGSIGISVGRAAYPYLEQMLGLGSVFAIASLFYATAALVVAVGFRVRLAARGRGAGRRSVHGGVARAVLVNAASGFAVGLDAQVLYPLLMEKGLDRFTASHLLSLGSLLGIPSKLASGAMGDRLGVYKSMLVLGAVIAASLAMLSTAEGLAAGIAALVYTGVSTGLVPLARMAAALEGRRLGAPAAVVGVANTLSNVGSIAAALAVPVLASTPGGLVAYAAPLLALTFYDGASGRRVARVVARG